MFSSRKSVHRILICVSLAAATLVAVTGCRQGPHRTSPAGQHNSRGVTIPYHPNVAADPETNLAHPENSSGWYDADPARPTAGDEAPVVYADDFGLAIAPLKSVATGTTSTAPARK